MRCPQMQPHVKTMAPHPFLSGFSVGELGPSPGLHIAGRSHLVGGRPGEQLHSGAPPRSTTHPPCTGRTRRGTRRGTHTCAKAQCETPQGKARNPSSAIYVQLGATRPATEACWHIRTRLNHASAARGDGLANVVEAGTEGQDYVSGISCILLVGLRALTRSSAAAPRTK